MVERKKFLEKLWALKDQNIIKVVTGVRRCGKSTLLLEMQEKIKTADPESTVVAINFEDAETPAFADWRAVYDYVKSIAGGLKTKTYIFLDEVQNVSEFERLVDGLFVNPNVDLYITGSNAFMLSGEIATLLSGRYIEINLMPYSFSEFTSAFANVQDAYRLFFNYLNKSSFPQAVTLSHVSPESENDYLRSIYNTVIVRDIVKRHGLRKTVTLDRLVSFMFNNIGNISSPDAISAALKSAGISISENTIRKMIGYLTEAYLLYPAKRFDIKGKRLLSSNPKYYAVDLGIRNILETNRYDGDLGHKLENVVYFELLRRGYEVFVGKAAEDREIDFVAKKAGGMFEYYQVAYTASSPETFEREIRPLKAIRDFYPKYILTTDFDEAVVDGIQKLNVVEWLLRV